MQSKLEDFQERYSKFIIKYRLAVILSTLFVVVFFAYFLKDFAIEGSYRIWFGENSKVLQEYDEFVDKYSTDTAIVIGFEDKNGIFSKENIDMIVDIQDKLAMSKHVISTHSLVNFSHFAKDNQTNNVIVGDFLSPSNLNNAYLENKSAQAKNSDLIGTFLSSDLNATIIVGKVSKECAASESLSYEIIDEVKKILLPYEASGVKFYLVGQPVINTAFVDIALEDGVFYTTLSVVLVLLMLLVFLRSVLASFVPMLVVIFTIIIVISIQTILGYKINSFTANIPIFVVGIGVVHAVHVYWVWAIGLKKGLTSEQAVAYSIEKNFIAIFLTSFTTAIGFLSLAVSDTIPIRTLGLATGSAAMLAFVITILFVPALLSYFNPNTKDLKDPHPIDPKKYAKFIVTNDKKIIILTSVMLVFFGFGITKTHIDNNSIKYFQEEHEFTKAMQFITNKITGPMTYEITIDSKVVDGVKEPRFLELVLRFEDEYKAKFSQIRGVYSLANLVAKMHNQNGTLPQTSQEVAQYLLLFSMSQSSLSGGLGELVDIASQEIRISCNVENGKSSHDIEMIQWAKEWWKSNGYEARFYGQTPMFSKMHDDTTNTLVYSLSGTVFLISLTMLFIFKRVNLLGYFIIPNIAPIVVALGAMGWFGFSIDMGIAIAVAVVFGIAVDDTIHFFSKYLMHRNAGFGVEESIAYVMHYTGGAIMLTTIIISISFGVLAFSSFNPNVYFAITTVSALLIALVADLLLVPALFSYFDKRKLKNRPL